MWIKCSERLPACGQRVLIRDEKAIYSALYLNAVAYREGHDPYNPISQRLRWSKDVKQIFLPDTQDREVKWLQEIEEWMECPA